MGVDGDQVLTIYGPKKDIDALEACGCELTEKQSNVPYPVLEGINYTYVKLQTEPRYTYFACHKKTPDPEAILFADWNDPAEVLRIHDRKLVVKHIYRNGAEYSFFVLLLANYPKCCLVNEIYAEEGYRERIMLRFTPQCTVHVHLVNWKCGGQGFHKYCSEFRKKTPLINEPISLDRSHIDYTLRIFGSNMEPVCSFFKTKGVIPENGSIFRFLVKNHSPTTKFINNLRRRFSDCVIHGVMEDLHGNHIEIVDCEDGYDIREWKNITIIEEETLNDFSLKI